MALVRCDVVVNTDTKLADFAKAVADGLVKLLPCGKIRTTPSFETSSDVSDCGGDVVLETTYDVVFETYQTAKDKSDYAYYKAILKTHPNWRLLIFDCDGCVAFNSEFTDAIVNGQTYSGNPGFDFTISSNPDEVEGDAGRVKWTFTSQLVLDGQDMLCYTPCPGLLEALQA